jgi:hypothetical protein
MMLPTSVNHVNISIGGTRFGATLAITRGEGLRMTLMDVTKQPWIISVDFFRATTNLKNKLDEVNSYSLG